MVTFVPLQEAFFVPGERLSEIPPPPPPPPSPPPAARLQGQPGWKVMAAGRRLCERRGYYCYKFHHLSR